MLNIVEKYTDGHIEVHGLVAGWYPANLGRFRPLPSPDTIKLFVEGWIDEDIVHATALAREEYELNTAREYFDEATIQSVDEDLSDFQIDEIIHLADY